MRAFWKKTKTEDHERDIKHNSDISDIQEEENTTRNVAEQTPRISRNEYKKMQNAAEREQTITDRKTAAKEALMRIALKYILPAFTIYIAFIVYQYFPGNVLVKYLGTSYFWIIHILFLSIFVAVHFIALSYMFDGLPKIRRSFGAIAWIGSLYFYVIFLINNDARSPVLAAMILFVTGVVQLTNLNRNIKGSFILLGTVYGNYLTSIDFHNVWLILGVGGLFIMMEKRVKEGEAD